MKKFTLGFSVLALSSVAAVAQVDQLPIVNEPLAPAAMPRVQHSAPQPPTGSVFAASASTVIWSEDFSSGIPSGWTNQGYLADPFSGTLISNSNAVWEYRGPNTTPDNTVGSRGAFASGGFPLASATASNGFVIFDSDYLDNGGDDNQMGQGPAPAPHIGTLSTSTIDLSGHPNVELSFASYLRHFSSRYLVAMSTDGGSTFPDTVGFHTNLNTSELNDNGSRYFVNLSSYVGGHSNVVLTFIFDGSTQLPGVAGSGYYFWAIDDIEISGLAKHQLNFVKWNNSPEHDVIYPPRSPKYGNVHLDQAVPIAFDSNVHNYGLDDQTNVQLQVEVLDSLGTSVASLSSPVLAQLPSGDTATWQDLTTGTWTPSAPGAYDIVYKAASDSIPAAQAPAQAVYTLQVNDSSHNDNIYSADWGGIDNYVGTNSLANGSILALGVQFDFPNSDPDSSGYVFVEGVSVPFSSDTDPAAVIVWEVFDTTGFSYGSNGPAGRPIFDTLVQLNSSAPGTEHFFDFKSSSGKPLALPAGGAYHFVMYMVPSTGNDFVRVGNDQTVVQPIGNPAGSHAVIALTSTGHWFGRFSNSDNLSSPIYRLHMANISAFNSDPTASFTATPQSGFLPLAVGFDASATVDPDGDSLTYAWDFGDGNVGSGVTTGHTYTAWGSYWAVLTVSDGQGGTAKDSLEIVVIDPNNSVPTASFTATPDSGTVPLSVTFDATGSSDPDNDPLAYSWNFGDGNNGSGAMVGYTYNNIGSYWATLTVSDGKGGVDQDSIEITVLPVPNAAPTAAFTATPDSGAAPLMVAFDASGSIDPDNDPLTYTWDFGDGNGGSGATANYTYNAIGNYWAVLSVSDGNGGTDMDSTEIVVSQPVNLPPTASFTATPDSGVAPLLVSFDASASSDPNNDPLSYTWYFGDGMNGVGHPATHVYQTAGTFCAVLTVDDGNGGTDQDSICITVSPALNTLPVVAFTATPDTGTAPLLVAFDASTSYDADGDSLGYTWNFGDGNAATGVNATNTYNAGTVASDTVYWAVLSVDDGTGNASDSTAILVRRDISMAEYRTGSWAVYPNPSEGTVFISSEEDANVTLELLGITGKKLYSEEVQLLKGEKLQRDFSHLPKGTYFIGIREDGLRSVRKLTIK